MKIPRRPLPTGYQRMRARQRENTRKQNHEIARRAGRTSLLWEEVLR